MKAWQLNAINDFSFEDVKIPILKKDEVLVKVRAVGICGSDIPRIYTSGTYHYPLIPGHEFSGDVIESGGNDGKKWVGKAVGVFPLIPCGECEPCKLNLFEMCRKYSYIGSRQAGAFAEYVAVPIRNLIELPDGVGFDEAAMLEPMAVAAHAIRRILKIDSSVDKNLKIAVCGLGTIGLLIVMLLREMGMQYVFAIGNKDFQLEKAINLGIDGDNICDTRKNHVNDYIMDRTSGKGIDIFFECVGKNETVLQAIDLTVPAGKIILVGNPYTDMFFERNVYWKILRNQLTIMGTWNSSFTHNIKDDWHYVLACLKDGKISPRQLITHKFPLYDLHKGCEMMRDKTEDYIKVMIEM